MVRGWDRSRILGLLWLVGSLLTALTVALPYDSGADPLLRAAVAALALGTGLALVSAPPLPDWALHGVLAMGLGVIAFCTSLGMPDVEGVLFLLPVLYAFATFPPARAVPHLVLMAVLLGIVLLGAAGDRSAAPLILFVLLLGVAGVSCAALALLLRARERAVLEGERDRHIAATLQEALLPSELPAPRSVRLAARYVAAADEADVGGDLYDALELPDGRIAVMIGDVAGKGLAAAATMGRVRAAARAYVLDETSPAEVLRKLDRLLGAEPGPPTFVTLVLAIVDPAANTVTCALGGHPPPLLVPARGAAHFVDRCTGVPLGVLADGTFEDTTLPFDHGDRLLLYTDGLVERRGVTVPAALDHLVARVRATVGLDLVDAALAAFDVPPRDDVAVLAVALVPPGGGPAPAPAATVGDPIPAH